MPKGEAVLDFDKQTQVGLKCCSTNGFLGGASTARPGPHADYAYIVTVKCTELCEKQLTPSSS